MRIRHILLATLASLPAFPAAAQDITALSLRQCRELALAHSEEAAEAANSLEQARLDVGIASAASLPKLDGSASATYLAPDIDMAGAKLRMRGMYMAGVSLTQPVYAGGRITASRRLARVGEDAAREQLRAKRMDVIAEADNAYFTYVAVRGKLSAVRAYMAQVDTLYSQTATAVAAGMATEGDLLRVSAKRGEITYQLQKAENGADLCRLSLCRVIGAGADARPLPVDTALEAAPPGELDAVLGDRPELRLLEKQAEADKLKIRVERASLLPTLGLTAGYTYYGNVKMKGVADVGGMRVPYTKEFRDGMAVAMLSLNVPLFHWGEQQRKIRKATLDYDNSCLELQRNTRLMDIEARQAACNVRDGYAMTRSAATALGQAKESLRVTRARHAEAMATLADLLDAQAQWQQAESNLTEARAQYRIYQTQYLRATGRLGE